MKKYGLIGKTLSYSFSKNYFSSKFSDLGIAGKCIYENFELDNIDQLHQMLSHETDLVGFNVTIPYKEQIMPLLNEINSAALEIGAVNTVKITRSKTGQISSLTGYNTDYFGFLKALSPLLKDYHRAAMVLGTGGASKAVMRALKELEIPFIQLSRNSGNGIFGYSELNEELMNNFPIIINTTPVGTFPDVHASPNIPYQFINDGNLLFDLVYNPAITKFMQEGLLRGAEVSNGMEMLKLQADEAWKIWNTP